MAGGRLTGQKSTPPTCVGQASVRATASSQRPSSPVFIGRDPELLAFDEALARAASGEPAVFVIRGEAGVGKSRLIAEVSTAAAGRGFRVLTGGCTHLRGGALPYEPFVEALRDLPVETADERSAPTAMADVFLEPFGPGRAVGAAASPMRLFELILRRLRHLAAESPVLLVVEDVHWADRSTLDLLSFLIRSVRDGIVLTTTFRTDEPSPQGAAGSVLAELEQHPIVRRVDLGRLERPDLERQLEAIVGGRVDPAVVERIWRRSQGNPFLAEELFAAGDPGAVPETVRDVLLARYAAVSEPTRRLLALAAVAGQQADQALLEACDAIGRDQLPTALREALDRAILLPSPDPGRDVYSFRHALMAEAIYADLLPMERKRMHAALAQAIERGDGRAGESKAAAEIAHHWLAANDSLRALPALIAAGRAAERAYAMADALSKYEQAIELWEHVPNAESVSGLDLIELHAMAGTVAHVVQAPRGVVHLQEAIALLRHAVDDGAPADPLREAILHERLADCASEALDGVLALEAARQAVHLVPEAPGSVERAAALASLGKSLMLSGLPHDAVPVLREALAMSRKTAARNVEGHVLVSLGQIVFLLGSEEEGERMCREARELGLAMGDHYLTARAWALLVACISYRDPDTAAAEALRAFEHTQAQGYAVSYGITELCIAIQCLYWVGRWDEADEVAVRAGELPVVGLGAYDLASTAAPVDIGRGRLAAAEERLAPLREWGRRFTDGDRIAAYLSARAELANAIGDIESGRDFVDEALELPVMDLAAASICPLFFNGLRLEADAAVTARALRHGGEFEEAERRGRVLADLMRSYMPRARTSADRAIAASHLALCDAELGRLQGTSDALAWATAATRVSETRFFVHRAGYARFRQAEAMLEAGQPRSAAASPLKDAREMAVRLGADLLLRDVEALASRGRIELPSLAATPGLTEPPVAEPPLVTDLYGLSPREREVLALVLQGRTNREIGAELFISEKTAGVHVSHILNKLGVPSRAAAAAVAARLETTPETRD